MISIVLTSLSVTLFAAAFLGALTRMLKRHVSYGLYALACAFNVIRYGLEHQPAWAALNTGAGALLAWWWWQGGGGDDTKRRLRRLARKFSPVRRTAPQAA